MKLKPTSTGKWLLEAFMKKEIDGQDQGLATIIDVIQYYDADYDSGDLKQDDAEGERLAILLGLISK